MIISTFFDNIVAASEQSGLSLGEVAKRCLGYGVTGVDVEDCEVADARLGILLGAGMQVTSMPTRRDLLHSPTKETVEEVVALAVRNKVPRILMIPGYIGHDEDKTEAMRTAVEPLRYLCTLAAKEGIVVGVEDYDHEDAPTHTIGGLKWFLDEVPELSCIFDTGNFLYAGEDVREAYRLMKHRITSQLHCKDRALTGRVGEAAKRSMAGVDMYSSAVGCGIIPIGEMIKDLVKSGFDGAFTAELFGSPDVLGDLKLSAEYINEIARAR